MRDTWKSDARIPWEPEADEFLEKQLRIHSKEKLAVIARKILDHPHCEGRSEKSFMYRLSWIKNGKQKIH